MTPTDLPDLLRRRADAPSFRAVDLDAVVRSGTRLRRRRRAGTAVAGLALAGLIGGSVALLTSPDAPRAVDPAGSVSPGDRPLSYALDGVLHVGDRTITPDGGIATYVEVGDGFGVVGTDGRVRLIDGSTGTATLLSTEGLALTGAFVRLATDGRWLAWAAPQDAGRAVVHFHDTVSGTGRVLTIDLDDQRSEQSALVSLDAGRAYLVTAEGPVEVSIPAPDEEPRVVKLAGRLPGGQTFVDARGGTIARYEDGLLAGPSWDLARPPGDGPAVLESTGVLSPDGSAFAPEADTIRIVTLDGADETPDVGRRYAFFSTVYRWLDDDTVAVIAGEKQEGPYALLRCSVTSGSPGACSTEVTLPDPDGLQLPVGTPTG